MADSKDSLCKPSGEVPSRRLYGLRTVAISALVGLLLVSVPPIMAYTYLRDTRAILNVSTALINRISDTVIDKVTLRLWHAAKLAEMSAQFFSPRMHSLTEDPELQSYLVSALKTHSSMTASYVGDEHGNFLMVKRFADGTIGTEIVDRSVQRPMSTWTYKDFSGKVLRSEASGEIKYDPRTRPWYQGAKQSGKLYLTDLYVFFTDQQPGVTISTPVTDAAGNLIGVFGMDTELSEIVKLLEDLKVGKSGVVFITDDKHRILGYPDSSHVMKTVSGEPRLANIDEVGIDCIAAAYSEHERSGADRFVFKHRGVRYLGSFTPFPEMFGNPWKISVVVPEDDFIGPMKKTIRLSFVIASIILFGSVILAVAFAHSISTPILLLSKEAARIRDFNLDHEISMKPSIREIRHLAAALSSMKTGLQMFGKYVPAELVRQLIQTGEVARLGGKKKELTFFFSDIAGFTPISEGMSPESLMIHISEYLDELGRIIMEERGTIDKYIGDSIMAFWGAPVSDPDHALHACTAALACQKRIDELNEKWRREGKAALHTRIGIHTGEAIVGNVGSSERMNYTVLGDSVNLASRLEGVNKIYGTRIIISQSVYERVSEQILCRPLDFIAVKGREKGIRIYEVIGKKGDSTPAGAAELCEAFQHALGVYMQRDWERALKMFSQIHQAYPTDGPTALYMERCRRFRQEPPEAGWTGVMHLSSK